MNCWHCQKELPPNYPATYCPFCGETLPDLANAQPSEPLLQENRPTNWPRFWVLLFAPAILTFIAMTLNIGEIALVLGLVGSLICGLSCARIVMTNITTSGFERALLHLGMAVLLFGLSLFISVVGCSFGGIISNHSL